MKERMKTIKEYMLVHQEATLEKLCALFPDLSAMTVRRDLTRLEESGFLIRTHGGARLNPMHGIVEANYAVREVENRGEKLAIARKAVAFIEDRRAIYVDSGTTAMAFAGEMPDKAVTVLTSGPNIALDLAARKQNVTVMLLGGVLRPQTLSLSGRNSLAFLSGINIDTAFIGASGFSLDTGFTLGSVDECDVKRTVIAQARRVVVMMDLSKVGRVLPYTFAHLPDIDILVCEDGVPDELRQAARLAGVEVF